MVYYSRKVRCPYCNHWTDHSSSTILELVGNPHRTCSHCKAQYWDFAYTENAVYYYNRRLHSRLAYPIICAVVCLVMLTVSINDISAGNQILGVGMFAVSLIGIFFVIKPLIKEIDLTIHKEKRLLKIEDTFNAHLSKDTLLGNSLARLNDHAYLDFLTDNDVEIPDYFYQRINYNPPEKYKEKHAKKYKKDKDELAELLEKQKIYNNAKHFLKIGSHSKEFKDIAHRCNMDESEFTVYCEKTIVEYEEMHRKYNLTHSTPAPWLNSYE